MDKARVEEDESPYASRFIHTYLSIHFQASAVLGDGDPSEGKKKQGPCPRAAYSLVEKTVIDYIILLSSLKLQLRL